MYILGIHVRIDWGKKKFELLKIRLTENILNMSIL